MKARGLLRKVSLLGGFLYVVALVDGFIARRRRRKRLQRQFEMMSQVWGGDGDS